jgi:predicted GNAT family acetyltransferase
MENTTRNTQQSRFEIERDGQLAVADYELSPGEMAVTHIIVPPSLQGQGVASALAEAIVQNARAERIKVRPLCSFMAAHFQRHPENSDLLA